MIPSAEYVAPEPPRLAHGMSWEYVSWGLNDNFETRTTWNTQTANQAIGTSYLCGAREVWLWNFGEPVCGRAEQAALVGFGAL